MNKLLHATATRAFEQLLRTEHVGHKEWLGTLNGAINVTLSREVHHGVRAGQNVVDHGRIVD